MTDKQAYAGLLERLRLPIDNEETLSAWDKWRKYIKEGGGASWPRDAFECLLSNIDEERAEAAEAISSLLKALDLACRILGDMEPPDSRAVSNEFVAMFSVLCGNANDECHEIIEAAIAEHEARAALNSDAPLSTSEGEI